MFRPPGFVMPTMGPRSTVGSTSTTKAQPNGTQTGEPTLQTNVESGEPRGVAWNSCASSAAMLVLVAIGVVVLL